MQTQAPRLLVKHPGARLSRALGAVGNRFRMAAPLFAAAAAGERWDTVEAEGHATIPELWDAAYELHENSGAVLVEPDCETLFPTVTTRAQRAAMGVAAGGAGRVNPQSAHFPQGPGFAWHLGAAYSQLEQARAAIGGKPQPVRVAILDVGFDFDHKAMPENLDRHLEKNFVDDGRTDASDPNVGGFLKNPGHGTATIAILAGRKLQGMSPPTPDGVVLGGAPEAHIVPIRVATSVVMLSTSAFARAIEYLVSLQADPSTAVDVVSMSMGGVASDAWAEMVNRAYEAGILLVTAAGNNFGRPKSIVYPARFRRVLAACGAMADYRPYELGFGTMSGNYGPDSKMDTAITAYTPNIPWAELGAPEVVDWDGQGTSSATPQVAAAAALWLQKHKAALAGWQGWERVEMIRHALFASADGSRPPGRKYLGRGLLRANDALAIRPTAALRKALVKQADDSASLAFWRLWRGTLFPVAARAESPLDRMFELELAQLIHRDGAVEAAIADPEKGATKKELEEFRDAVLASPYLSQRLRQELESRSGAKPGRKPQPAVAGGKDETKTPAPTSRRLRVFSFDPSAGRSLESFEINQTVVKIPWEDVQPGPSGEYVEVIDHDPASACFYAPVDLNEAGVLANEGLAPAEGNPKFHQQMVYAVTMRTIDAFETALGRRAIWSPRMQGARETEYVGQLRIYPHALREENAYYDPVKKALLFGYFPASPADPSELQPGGMVFTCLSHDIVAHETAHALLDGMARGLTEPTNLDMSGFHEAFADIAALFQHFTLPGVLEHQIAKVRGDLRDRNLLGELAQEFGRGFGLRGALRSYIGHVNEETGIWERQIPKPTDYSDATEEHDRGAVLVAAIFDAFLAIYERRIADLKRIASEGTGILREGDIHPDLVERFAKEARKAAMQVLQICIRGVDYYPPVDQTFGDYLRAIITADYDLYPEDSLDYRVSLIEAFRKRGIFPLDVRTMSEGTLRWRPLEDPLQDLLRKAGEKPFRRLAGIGGMVRRLSNLSGRVPWPPADRKYLNLPQPSASNTGKRTGKPLPRDMAPREAIYHLLRQERAVFHKLLSEMIRQLDEPQRMALGAALGLDLAPNAADRVSFEVRAINFADRMGLNGRTQRDAIIWLQQVRQVEVKGERFPFEGGCTLIVDLDTAEIRYAVSKSINSRRRQQAVADFRRQGSAMGMTYYGRSPFAGSGRRFAMLHQAESRRDTYA